MDIEISQGERLYLLQRPSGFRWKTKRVWRKIVPAASGAALYKETDEFYLGRLLDKIHETGQSVPVLAKGPCSRCDGAGQFALLFSVESPCQGCGGSGYA